MRKVLSICLPLLVVVNSFYPLPAVAQYQTVHYTENTSDIPNPERGFYLAAGGKPGELSVSELQQLKATSSVKSPNAKYAVWITLVYRGYGLSEFVDKKISPEFLILLQKDFDAIRSAGLKMILRFSYTDKTHPGNCPDKEICPPYGDAPKAIVLQHISQLKPLLQKNADVIAVMQQGFIGIWGENHYTDYFGDASPNALGFVPDSSWVDRNEVLKALLDALPRDRMVQVRTPQIKQRFLYGPHAALNSNPLNAEEAYNGSNAARIAFHNDCFLSTPDDYGTYSDYGNSLSKNSDANTVLRQYAEADTRYTAVGGETCDDAFSPQNDCPPLGHAIGEMEHMHYSFLNVSYNNLVNNDWEEQGCMAEIKRRLGYRLVLEQVTFPQKIKRGKPFAVRMRLENKGFASPYNPRTAYLVLRSEDKKQVYRLPLKTNVQKWFPGKINLAEYLVLPADIKPGRYELLLNLPDAYRSLQNQSGYSIQLANVNTWEQQTGYNKLNYTIEIN